MLRNEVLSNTQTAGEELAYLIRLRDAGSASRASLVGEELEDLSGYLGAALKVCGALFILPAGQESLTN